MSLKLKIQAGKFHSDISTAQHPIPQDHWLCPDAIMVNISILYFIFAMVIYNV